MVDLFRRGEGVDRGYDKDFIKKICEFIVELSTHEFIKDEAITWKISNKWAKQKIACTKDAILKGCFGKCCTNKSFWPSRLSEDNRCIHLSPTGCTLSEKDKPVLCLLFPFMKKKDSNSIHLYFRAKTTCCKPNADKEGGITIIESLKGNLTVLLGEENVNYILNCVSVDIDPIVRVSKHIAESLDREFKWDEEDINPIPRSQFENGAELEKDSEFLTKLKMVNTREELREVIDEIKNSFPDGHFKFYSLMNLEYIYSGDGGGI